MFKYTSRKHMIKRMASLKVSEVKFELPCVLTRGVCEDKHSGYSIPVELDEDSAIKVGELSEENNTKSPLYGNKNILYLRVSDLTPKQKKELLDKGESYVLINFTFKGINTARNGVKYLSFKVTKLCKVEKPDDDDDDDSCPED